jgi:hypothetical protein
MANVDFPHGLNPVGRTITGGQPLIQQVPKDASATVVYIHDCVQRDADGYVSAGVATPIVGVALHYSAATTAENLLVICSPGAIFEAQDNADTDGTAQADIGSNANIEANAGSSTTLISGHELDESSYNTTATLHVHLMELFKDPLNAAGANARVLVCFNAAAYGSQTTGV